MVSDTVRGLALVLCFASVAGCSNFTGKTADSESEAAVPLMVIEKSAYERDKNKLCMHTRECTAPLSCLNGQCTIPPSILGKPLSNTPKISLNTSKGSASLWIEIVDDEYTMQRGLMMRRACQPGWGMLFIYPDEAKRAFWMHNTNIALDMVFIRADGSVSNVVKNAEPLNDVPRYLSTDRVKYVLEVAAGEAERLGIESGSQFDVKGF